MKVLEAKIKLVKDRRAHLLNLTRVLDHLRPDGDTSNLKLTTNGDHTSVVIKGEDKQRFKGCLTALIAEKEAELAPLERQLNALSELMEG